MATDLPIFLTIALQAAYSFWVCSNHLPLYLRPTEYEATRADTDGSSSQQQQSSSSSGQQQRQRPPPVQINPCGSVCREVERRCPFFIKGEEDDRAAGNPSFICKGWS